MQRLRTPVKLRNAIFYAEDKTDSAVVFFEEQAVDQAAVAVEQGQVGAGAEIGEMRLHICPELRDERAAAVN